MIDLKDYQIKVFRAGKLFCTIEVWQSDLNDNGEPHNFINCKGQTYWYPLPGLRDKSKEKELVKVCEFFANPYRPLKIPNAKLDKRNVWVLSGKE